MPSPDEVFGELEAGRALREGEVRLLQNLAILESDEERQATLRRSLVLIAYAHLEGFCKVAMESYATAVNSVSIPCSEAVAPLVAATLHRAFVALRDIQSKHPTFAKSPDDSELHMTWREQTFVEKAEALMSTTVDIPDGVVNTEANLSPSVLKRNMYRLGLAYGEVEGQRAGMNRLLGKRNEIAHGELVSPSREDVEAYVVTAFEIMLFVQQEVFEALNKKAYRKVATA
jgi:hypothetical protein